jgi:hypothetical protein
VTLESDVVRGKRPDDTSPSRADLSVQIGRSQLKFATGDIFKYSLLTTDVESQNGYDNFPYDSYTFKGNVRVGPR